MYEECQRGGAFILNHQFNCESPLLRTHDYRTPREARFQSINPYCVIACTASITSWKLIQTHSKSGCGVGSSIQGHAAGSRDKQFGFRVLLVRHWKLESGWRRELCQAI